MGQGPANARVSRKRYDLLPVRAVAAVVLAAEGDAALGYLKTFGNMCFARR